MFDFDSAAVQGGMVSPLFQTAAPNTGKAAADLVVTRLVQAGAVTVIERTALDKVLGEQNLSNSDRTDPALLVTHLSMSAAGTEQGGTSWAKVEQLRLGQTIRVLCSGQQSWTGRLAGVSADALVLDVGGTERKTVRSQVLRVQVKSRARSALIGLGIGAAAGVGVGYVAGSRANLKPGERTAAAGLGAGLFAAAGAGIGALSPGWKTVYRVEQPVSPPRNALSPK